MEKLSLVLFTFVSSVLTVHSSCSWIGSSCYFCTEPFMFHSSLKTCISKTYYAPNKYLYSLFLNENEDELLHTEQQLQSISLTQICDNGYILDDIWCVQCNPNDFYVCNGMCVHIEYDVPIVKRYKCNSDDVLIGTVCYHCIPPKQLNTSSLTQCNPYDAELQVYP